MADLVLKTYKEAGYNAINIGEYDLSLGVGYLKEWQERLSLPFISANLVRKKDGKVVFRPFYVVKMGSLRVGITGLIKKRIHWSRIKDGNLYKVADPFKVIQRQTKILMSQGVDLVVLLTDMTAMGCRKIAHLNLPIDIIIGSSRRNRLSLPKVTQHRVILHLSRYGKYIGKLSLFCPWERGKLRFTEENLPGMSRYDNAFVPLTKDLPKDKKIAEWMDSYLEKIRLLKAQLAVSSKRAHNGIEAEAHDGRMQYVGAEKCKKCHLITYKLWKSTRHSHAFLSLVKRGNQYDPDCIRCHSTGFEMKGGFKKVSKKEMMTFVNVQCEACHGPGSLHVERGGDIRKIRRKVTRKVCIRCHTEENSPNFNYQVYLIRLACGGKSPKIKAERGIRKQRVQPN